MAVLVDVGTTILVGVKVNVFVTVDVGVNVSVDAAGLVGVNVAVLVDAAVGVLVEPADSDPPPKSSSKALPAPINHSPGYPPFAVYVQAVAVREASKAPFRYTSTMPV